MSNQSEQHDSDTESNHDSGSAPTNTSSPESHSDSTYDSNLRIHIGSPSFLRNMNMDNGFKQWVAMSAAYSVGISAWNSWNSSSQARERRRRREAEEREREEREAREAGEERERRESERREALERLMQDL
ncbi:hypothetical protein FOYG_14082 [Fusarium oxysporum NRRL 32931]|uniref:Uncharacterized protein n=1 Tax=Fusarium oxysporum NRRL 32931 TaxID=660029 RepID=W9HTK2_FUSOX|nr:hypothetical protein FOYG_14082 [Fusarium oxysporum NRRL 32931]